MYKRNYKRKLYYIAKELGMKEFLFCIYFLSISLAFSQEQFDPSLLKIDLEDEYNLYYNEKRPAKKIMMTKDTITFFDETYSNEMETYPMRWENEYRNKYIIFNYTGKSLGNNISHGIKKYLVLFSLFFDWDGNTNWLNARNIALYDSNNKLVFSIMIESYSKLNFSVTATSELKEKDTIYEIGNILDITHLKPWAEGAQGNGAGEKITAVIPDDYYNYGSPLSGHCRLLISNGFVDYNRPYLYEYNNRIRSLRIYYDDDREKYTTIILEDKPDFQLIGFNHYDSHGRNITIEIDEVYMGSRYNDTCINYLQLFEGT
jgi:hypothetical protein